MKSHEENNTSLLSKAFGRVHSIEIFDIPRAGSLANTNNLRLTDRVMIKGIRLQKYFENPSTLHPLVVHVAVVTSKGASPGETGWGDAGVNWQTGFFRQYGANIREAAFDNTLLGSFEVNSNPINSDRFIIHKRWMKVLEPEPSAVSGDTRPTPYHQWVLNKYIPINRVINFQDTQDHAHDSRTFVIFWFERKHRDPGTAVAGSAANHSSRIITFFRDKGL